jgi:hypothetical protein
LRSAVFHMAQAAAEIRGRRAGWMAASVRTSSASSVESVATLLVPWIFDF